MWLLDPFLVSGGCTLPCSQKLHRPDPDAGGGGTDQLDGTLGPIDGHSGSSELAGSTEWPYDFPKCQVAWPD
jgi:hypothetical protein